MRLSTFALLALTFCGAACTAPAGHDDQESTAESESDLRKRVKPKGGNGAFALVPGNWTVQPGTLGGYAFDSNMIGVSGTVERVPGSYRFASISISSDDGRSMSRGENVQLTAGQVLERKATGLRVRYDQPLTLSAAEVQFGAFAGGDLGQLRAEGPWAKKAAGVTTFVEAGTLQVRTAASSVNFKPDALEGTLTEIVLPTTRLELSIDTYDAQFPNAPQCVGTRIFSRTNSSAAYASVRNADGSAIGDQVVAQGDRATVEVNTYGVVQVLETLGRDKLHITLNRLEVEDVAVTTAQGVVSMVPGTFSVDHISEQGAVSHLSCTFKTGMGLDVPNGRYRVTSRAPSSNGEVVHVEEVTFP